MCDSPAIFPTSIANLHKPFGRVEPVCTCGKRRNQPGIVDRAVLERPSAKIRPQNVWRLPLHKIWTPRKVPAIQYATLNHWALSHKNNTMVTWLTKVGVTTTSYTLHSTTTLSATCEGFTRGCALLMAWGNFARVCYIYTFEATIIHIITIPCVISDQAWGRQVKMGRLMIVASNQQEKEHTT